MHLLGEGRPHGFAAQGVERILVRGPLGRELLAHGQENLQVFQQFGAGLPEPQFIHCAQAKFITSRRIEPEIRRRAAD